MRSILEQKGKLKGKKVLLRLSLNVPVEEEVVLSVFKLKKALDTIEFLKKEEAKILIIGYIGRKKGRSLEPILKYFQQFFNVTFIKDILDDENKELITNAENGSIFLFENLRNYDAETDNDPVFAQKIASMGDIYINEAFPDSHRKYASIVGIPQYLKSYFGLNFLKEIRFLGSLERSIHPRLVILGGNKLKTKLPFVHKFVELSDSIFVGGSLANDFFKLKGYEVGESLVSNIDLGLGSLLENSKIILPSDLIVSSRKGVYVRENQEVLKEDIILDAGPQSVILLKKKIKEAKIILWNGPVGDYQKGFSEATFEIIRALADSKAETIVGGGDSVFCIEKLGLEDSFDFLSTGGGAMLKYLCEGTLVGIDVQEQKKQKTLESASPAGRH